MNSWSDALTRHERQVLRLRYGREGRLARSIPDVAASLGVSRHTALASADRGLRKLAAAARAHRHGRDLAEDVALDLAAFPALAARWLGSSAELAAAS